jgi:hypothetical protein
MFMQMDNAKQVNAELDKLFLKQAETLNAENLGDLTVEELLEYEQRYERIRELCARLLATKNLVA